MDSSVFRCEVSSYTDPHPAFSQSWARLNRIRSRHLENHWEPDAWSEPVGELHSGQYWPRPLSAAFLTCRTLLYACFNLASQIAEAEI